MLKTLRQPDYLGILREVLDAFSEEARTRGLPFPSLGGFSFVVVANDLSIVAGCGIASQSAMPAIVGR